MTIVDTRQQTRTEKKTYGGFVHQRIDDGNTFFIRVIERWDGDTNIPKELQNNFVHRQDVEKAIDTYNNKVNLTHLDTMTMVL